MSYSQFLSGVKGSNSILFAEEKKLLSKNHFSGKLLSRANKVAFMLLNKTISVGKDSSKIPICKPGDRVALIYPNTDPISFLSAFYGCILAGVVPVPMEVPLTKRDAGIQQLGFLLGGCGVRVALTSEACYKVSLRVLNP